MSNCRQPSSPNPGPSMEHLDSEINSLLKSSMACNTWKTYNSAIKSFDKFRQIYKWPDIWPVQDIVRYVAHLSHAKTSASTVATYISGLSHIHKLNGFDDPTKSFFVSKILEGLKRKNPGSKDLRMQLINSLPHVCKSSYEASMFASAFSVAFFFWQCSGWANSQQTRNTIRVCMLLG